jgi:hypothetical protein
MVPKKANRLYQTLSKASTLITAKITKLDPLFLNLDFKITTAQAIEIEAATITYK